MRGKEYAVVATGMRRAGQPAPLRLTRRGRAVVLAFFILLASLASAVLWNTASRAADPPAGGSSAGVIQPTPPSGVAIHDGETLFVPRGR